MSETTEVVYARKVIADANLGVFVAQVAEAAADGWRIDEQNPAGLYGHYYEVIVLKDENLIDKTPTRADIAANARSAKKVKAEAKAAETKPEDQPADEVEA